MTNQHSDLAHITFGDDSATQSTELIPSPDLLNEYHLYRKLHRRYVETGTLRFSSYLTIMGGLGLLLPIPHIIIGLGIALSSGYPSFAIDIGLLFLSVGVIMFYVLGVHFVQSWRLFKAPHTRMLPGQIIHVTTIWNAKPTKTYAFTSPSTGLEVTSTLPIKHASILTAPAIGESVLILYASDHLFRLL